MKAHANKTICANILCFLLLTFFTLWANDSKGNFVSSEPLVLHTIPVHGRFGRYDTTEIFCDEENHIIVLCKFGFWDNGNRQKETLLLVSETGKWAKSQVPCWGGMINDGVFQVYRMEDIVKSDDNVRRMGISVYNIEHDLSLSSKATNTFEIFEIGRRDKVFKQEEHRTITDVVPLSRNPGKFFVVGYYVENRLLNPINFILYLASAGHHGYVHRSFGAIVEQDEITGYYTTPEKLKTNDHSSINDYIVRGNKIHCVGIKSKEYSCDPHVIRYLSFDLSDKRWTEPVKLFQGYKETEKINQFFNSPSVACDGENVYCCWSWQVIDTTSRYNWPTRIKESGVYFCSKVRGKWNEPIKIVDLGIQPWILVDNKSTVYIFWIELYKGLFCKRKTDAGWSDTIHLVKDSAIRIKGMFFPEGPPSQPFSIAVDDDNNFHVIYIRDSSGTFGEEGFKPEELVYVKLKPESVE